jgi:hypothetical protein
MKTGFKVIFLNLLNVNFHFTRPILNDTSYQNTFLFCVGSAKVNVKIQMAPTYIYLNHKSITITVLPSGVLAAFADITSAKRI